MWHLSRASFADLASSQAWCLGSVGSLTGIQVLSREGGRVRESAMFGISRLLALKSSVRMQRMLVDDKIDKELLSRGRPVRPGRQRV